jgi:cobalt-zinc-cadmium efflux system protein
MAQGHGRGRGHDHGAHAPTASADPAVRAKQQRALRWALALNGGLLVAELVGGLVFGSLALLADAVHLLTDVVGLAIALLAVRLLGRPATDRHSYGLQRAEVLAAQANGLLLVTATIVITVESVRRLSHTTSFDAGPTLIIAAVGLVANTASALVVSREAGRSLNLRGAVLHLAGDAATSMAVVFAAVAELAWHAAWVDPAASLLIGAVIVWTAWALLRDTTHVLLEGTPRHLDPAVVAAALSADPAVASVHHLHMWDLASDTPALSAHVVLGGPLTLHEAQVHAERLKHVLSAEFGISHATLEVECHECATGQEIAFTADA